MYAIVKEQIETERQARRNYTKNWGKLKQPELYDFYNQNKLNRQLKEQSKTQGELCPYKYTGHGDSYFVSRNMYENLVEKCRCGRQRTCGHVLKCLQKEKNKYLTEQEEDVQDEQTQQKVTNTGENLQENNKNWKPPNVPETANAIIGWRPADSRYNQWEKSMKYVSPVLTMTGHRITAVPYTAIKIG